MSDINYEKLDPHVFVTKLAGFEHSEYIQPHATHEKVNSSDIPMVQGKNIRNGIFVKEYDWYINENISNSLPRSVLNKPCILIPYVGSNLGEVGIFYNHERCHLASNIAKVELIDNKYDLEYLKYYLQSPLGQKYLFKEIQGSSQPNITMQSIRDTLIIQKDLEEQCNIAKTLLSIDKKIENNKKINENLQQQLKLLYDYWFTQFDFPDENGKPYKSSGGKMIWNEKLKREIPIEFEVCNLYNNPLTSIIKPGVDHFSTKKYFATADVIGTDILEGKSINFETRESRANMQPTLNSVWFAKMKNSVKHLYLNKEMKSFINNSILSTGFCGVQCSFENFEYVSTFIEHSYFETLKDMLAHGATQEAVSNDDLASVIILIPTNNVLHKWHKMTNNIYAEISKNVCENRALIQLRDWLLPMLMNGQATISD